ncbi:MAG: PilZ domain-containing protein [Spirochaetes bacterium]|nr:PilZ domain-containing protein [Spirochaetota bacterium]
MSYEKKVELFADGRTFSGKSIDISNSGIQVVVNDPVSHVSVQRIAFTLPVGPDVLHIPCRVTRSESSSPEDDGQVLGIEFSYQTEAQMLLVENFIRDMKNNQLSHAPEKSDLRIIPRTACNLLMVSIDKSNVTIVSIDNISTEGCLISFEGKLRAHETIDIEFSLPRDSRRIRASCTVAYVINDYFKSTNRAGLFFTRMADIDSIKIHNFIVKSVSSTAIRNIQERRNEHVIGNEYQIYEQEKIGKLFLLLKKQKGRINVLFENSITLYELHIKSSITDVAIFTTTSPGEIEEMDLAKYLPTYFSFYLHGSSYYFKSELLDFCGERLTFAFPAVLYQSEKRSHERRHLGYDIDISVETDEAKLVQLQGRLVNISRRGFLCNVNIDPSQKELFKSGQPVYYVLERDLGLDSFGEIRHLKEHSSCGDGITIQMGIEAGIRRADFRFKKFSRRQWRAHKLRKNRDPEGANQALRSDVVSYMNRDGKEIVALLNYTHLHAEVPVVILPPAFGKKKEALSLLSATLIENFKRYGKDIVTLRYDGINRPGESYHEDMCQKRGYEMLHYRISSGLNDLEATVDFAYNNGLFRPVRVIVVAFSMSALDARKLALKDKRVDYLVNVMGATCARSAFRNVTGGIDIIGNARIGVKNGLAGVLGQILDLDTVARDLIENKYAYLADARHDMSKIDIPVTWIYGKYDRWICEREILDIMSVRGGGPREVIEIPTGHNLRSSEDAIKTFKMITNMIYRQIHGKNIRPFDPDRQGMVNLITYERERLSRQVEVDINEYWKDYLIGENRNSVGYDFYKNFDEFREFLSFQGSLVDLRNGEMMADFGCGTGIFIEKVLEDLALRGIDCSDTRLLLVDLVPEALEKTGKKYERLRSLYGRFIPNIAELIQMDLEPSRFLPVKRFMENRDLNYNYLRNRVEGLKNTTIDLLNDLRSEKLDDVMRGAPVTPGILQFLRGQFGEEETKAILDFNRAARYLSGTLTKADLAPSAASRTGMRENDYSNRAASEIRFDTLSFGTKGIEFNINFNDSTFDKITASLLVSYLFNPDEVVFDFYRLLKPGGRLIVSSMIPDSDISLIFINYINKVWSFELSAEEMRNREQNLLAARTMLNEAAALFQLEEDGYFRFYTGEELVSMLQTAGFINIDVHFSLGDPPQAVIATGIKPA